MTDHGWTHIDELIAPTQALGAEWSVSVHHDGSSLARFEHRPSTLLRTASVAKVFVLMELSDRLATGSIDAGQLVQRGDTGPVHDSGIWQAMRADALPVIDLAVLVGAHSDNWASNALIDVCGLNRIQALAAAVAPGGSMLRDRVRDERRGDVPHTLSEGGAGDWAGVMQRLYDTDSAVLPWLARNADLSMVAAAFDLDPLAHDTQDLGLRLWHKTGTDPGVRADVGVLASSSAVMSYAVVCNWPATDARASTRHAILATMRRIGEAIRSHMMSEDLDRVS